MGRIGAALATAIAIGFGFLTLWGLVSGSGLVFGITNVLLQLTMITIGVTILLGILNLFGVHLRKLGQRSRGWFYSLVVIVSAAVVLVLWALGRRDANQMLMETVQVSIESALTGLIVFALVFGAFRMMRRRVTWSAVLFTLALLVILVGALPLAEVGWLPQFRNWLLAVPVSAGARGILIGIALATVVTAVRVLIGQDRSYRE